MADIQNKILSKYGIDINQVNIPKLYKVESADVSPQELEEKISTTRRRWQQSVENGTNEKFIERDRNYLAKADDYEKILCDKEMLKELFAYYNKGNSSAGANDFVKEYFDLVSSTKRLKKDDVDFFFDYFPEEKKNRKAITEMLIKEYRVAGLGKAKEDDGSEKEPEGKRKNENSPLIVNSFDKATILKLRKAFSYFETASNSENVYRRFPKIKDGIYDFLDINKEDNIKTLAARVADRREKAFALRQEFDGFTELVDFYNVMSDVIGYRDIVDNFTEFKLLLKYPKLTPYMFELEDVKQDTLKKLFEIANRDYIFRDFTDFILSYFKVVYDNFNIHDQGIKSILRNAEKKSKKNAALNALDEKLGRKKKRKVPIWVNVVHYLVYWPIFLFYLVFETAKAIITEVWKFAIPIFAVLFIGTNWLFPKMFGIDNLLGLFKIFSKAKWLALVYECIGIELNGAFFTIVYSLITIILLLLVYVLPALFVSAFVYHTAKCFSDQFDWIGLERTFKAILDELSHKTETEYNSLKKVFLKKKIGSIIMNVFCVAIIAAVIIFAPTGWEWFIETTGWGQSETVEKDSYSNQVSDATVSPSGVEDEYTVEKTSSNEEETEEILLIITAETGNIRKGPSADTEKVTVATQGTTFIWTGNTETAANGSLWYELYLDDEKTETAWASEKIIKIQE